jgi:hypothetical protein
MGSEVVMKPQMHVLFQRLLHAISQLLRSSWKFLFYYVYSTLYLKPQNEAYLEDVTSIISTLARFQVMIVDLCPRKLETRL